MARRFLIGVMHPAQATIAHETGIVACSHGRTP
jgi:hypothetical protein